MKYKIYTDGACSGNPGPGGWAAIILVDDKIKDEISGSEKNTTNNTTMETNGNFKLKKILSEIFVRLFHSE